MNKTIYYNQLKITIGTDSQEGTGNSEILNYNEENKKELKTAIDSFLKAANKKNLIIQTSKITNAFEALKNELHFIEAAGGLIRNKNKYLFIKRLGKWDLPKGKLDKGETIKQAAVRECEEECAVKNLTIIESIPDTYHIYEYKNKFALKTTYWFLMETNYDEQLKPQVEENIEEVKWLSLDEIKKTVLPNTYITIKNLIKPILFS